MYCVAVCEDNPRTAEQNKIAVCRVLNERGRVQGRDYDVEVFHAATPLMERLTANSNAYQLLLLDIQLDGDNGVDLARFLRETSGQCLHHLHHRPPRLRAGQFPDLSAGIPAQAGV